jgi:hypothetical protein
MQRLNGDTPDISVLLQFNFWQKVYYQQLNVNFPSDSVKHVGHIVGISEYCGNALIYRLINPSTSSVVHRFVLLLQVIQIFVLSRLLGILMMISLLS